MGVARTLAAAAVALAGLAGCYQGDGHHQATWAACDVPSDCTLAGDSCCGPCGRPTLDDVDAVDRGHLDDHFADVCPSPLPCPECATTSNPDLLATCAAATCTALDVRQLALSACAVDDDCRLRVTGCCECGGNTEPWALIAIARTGLAAYQQLVCDPGQACPECAPQYPDTVVAICAPDGHCAVR